MKGLFSPEQDTITSYGIAYDDMGQEDNVYPIPDDYSFDRYTYQSITPGVFNPDGFTLIQYYD
jgi:hypothetical protein